LAFVAVTLAIVLVYELLTGQTAPSGILAGTSTTISEVNVVEIISGLFLAPLFESLLLAFLVWLMSSKLRWRPWITALVCALIFASLHGLAIGSLVVGLFFWQMALVQCNWMRRGDGLGGYWIVVTMHAIWNGTAYLSKAMSPFAGG
jgi:membrane protease YdiL (CAAX protease family)